MGIRTPDERFEKKIRDVIGRVWGEVLTKDSSDA